MTYRKAIFLAGPTYRQTTDPLMVKTQLRSWRKEAIKLLKEMHYDGVVLIPESKDGIFKQNYDDQVNWEEQMMNLADVIIFWIPRDLKTLPGFTTNIEWGRWENSHKIIYGAPKETLHNRYIEHHAEKQNIPAANTLKETLLKGIKRLGEGAKRTSGERSIPLHLWNTTMFQNWYTSLKENNNELLEAKILWQFAPKALGEKEPEDSHTKIFSFAIHANIKITDEKRNKNNEIIIFRPDTASVILYHKDEKNPLESKIVLVEEFRSPVNNANGKILEVAGGSSLQHTDFREIAKEEAEEELGYTIKDEMLELVEERQMHATLSSQKTSLYRVKITLKELQKFEEKSKKKEIFGEKNSTEQIRLKILSIQEALNTKAIDWAMLGQIIKATQY